VARALVRTPLAIWLREASPDTRALVEEFLAGDPDFARTLNSEPGLPPVPVSLSPDAEARAS
jgi:hypothetical protein